MRIQNEKWGIDVTLVDLRQRHVEAFSVAIQPAGDFPATKYRGEVIRAAVKAGWFEATGINPADIPEMHPAAVRVLSERLSEVFVAVNDVDPKG